MNSNPKYRKLCREVKSYLKRENNLSKKTASYKTNYELQSLELLWSCIVDNEKINFMGDEKLYFLHSFSEYYKFRIYIDKPCLKPYKTTQKIKEAYIAININRIEFSYDDSNHQEDMVLLNKDYLFWKNIYKSKYHLNHIYIIFLLSSKGQNLYILQREFDSEFLRSSEKQNLYIHQGEFNSAHLHEGFLLLRISYSNEYTNYQIVRVEKINKDGSILISNGSENNLEKFSSDGKSIDNDFICLSSIDIHHIWGLRTEKNNFDFSLPNLNDNFNVFN